MRSHLPVLIRWLSLLLALMGVAALAAAAWLVRDFRVSDSEFSGLYLIVAGGSGTFGVVQVVLSGSAALIGRPRLAAAFGLAGGMWSVLAMFTAGFGPTFILELGSAPYLALLPLPGLIVVAASISVLAGPEQPVVEV